MAPQWSTVISDAVLAAVCFSMIPHVPEMASVGYAVVGLAASAGVLRFYGISDVQPLHDLLSDAGGIAGLPLIGLAAQPRWISGIPLQAVYGIFAALVGARAYMGRRAKQLTLLTALLLISFALTNNKDLWIAGGVIGVATLALLGEGHIRVGDVSVRKVDAFHYVLAAGLYLAAKAL